MIEKKNLFILRKNISSSILKMKIKCKIVFKKKTLKLSLKVILLLIGIYCYN